MAYPSLIDFVDNLNNELLVNLVYVVRLGYILL